MSDIADRLRNWGHPDWFYVDTDLLEANQNVRLDAAEEIDRLRTALGIISKYSNEPKSTRAARVALDWPSSSLTSNMRGTDQ